MYGVTSRRSRWRAADLWLMLLLTVAAGAMSFWDLGNRSGPQTFWKPSVSGEGFVVDFGEVRRFDRLNLYEGPGATGKTKVEISTDGSNWEPYLEIEHKTNRVFTWKREGESAEARYVRFVATQTGYRLYEAAFFAEGEETPLPVAEVRPAGSGAADAGGGRQADGGAAAGRSTQPPESDPRRVFDEQDLAPYRPDYRNSMYFDEIYHGRTAYEFVEKMEPYEWTHPHMGKWLLSFGVRWFGMTPYGWRFMAAVFGTLMVPVVYAAAKGMFGRTRYAFLAALLLVLEGFRLVHSRMANVDVFGVTFTVVMFYAMHRYGLASWRYGGFGRSFFWLALSGIFLGLAASVKWNYLYGGAGLAVLLVIALARRRREMWLAGERGFVRRTVLTLLACTVFFVAVPAGIYAASYTPYLQATAREDGLKDLWQYQKNMYNYHKGVKEEHPYSSKWWTWPVMARPVWYYGGVDLDPGRAQSIAAIGNPAVWWGGLAALLAVGWSAFRRRDPVAVTLTVAFLSLYVPWIVAPRTITFLYHYFPMVPLLIFALVWVFRHLEEHVPRRRRLTAAFTALTAFLFVWFYPVYVGLTVSRAWVDIALRWLPSWGF
ncbi:MAG TPA: phospholipid carrier-dependent glycosyltransferase [Paenibacillaceae bacterium]